MENIEQMHGAKPQVLLFDVYGTLLDMELIEKKVNSLLDNKRGYIVWFEMFMQYCFVDNCLQVFHPFGDIGKATLQMAGDVFGEKVSEDAADEVLELLNHLPLQEDQMETLSRLYELDIKMAALTNAPQHIIESRMERTGLVSYFEKVLSAETVKKYKPAIEVYQWAAEQLNTQPRDILFISSHSWDVAGAANAGMQTVYLQQKLQVNYPLAEPPDFTFDNLNTFCDFLRSQYS